MSARRDLEHLERHIPVLLDRAGARGVAVFCCSGEGWWREQTLPVPVPARIIQEATFYVRPLAGVLDEYRRIMLVLIDRRRASLYQIQMGQAQRTDILGDVPSRVREAGFRGYAERTIHRHTEEHVRRHLEDVAARVFESFRDQGFDWLALGGSEPTLSEFSAHLHPYLAERLRGTLTISFDAPEAEVIAAGLALEHRIKAGRDAELLARVREGLFPGGPAISGPADTLPLVGQGRVHTLLVRPGYARPGVWCPRCRLLLPDRSACPSGCGEAVPSHDVIDEAVWLALGTGASVVHVEHEAMEELGNVAALLR
jgi:peptide subunit release factor 1 (eRF1)